MKTAAFLGPLEKKIMDILWRTQSGSVKTIWQELKREQTVAYTTVLTVLSRLFEKGLLTRQKIGKSFLYTPKVDKSQTVQSVIRDTMKKLIENFGDEAVIAFVDEAEALTKRKKVS